MALPITPTLTAQRWGREPWQLFDYLAHPTRDNGGNPVIVYLHPGGGEDDDYTSVWSLNREPAWTLQWMNQTTGLDTHFDVISLEVGQRSFTAGTINWSRKVWFMQAIWETQRSIAAIKTLGAQGFGSSNTYKINPSKIVLWGNSHGASKASLSQLMPPYVGSGTQTIPRVTQYVSDSYDSQCAGVIYHEGQPDIRKINGTDQLYYTNLGGWFGMSVTSATEWNAFPDSLKKAASVIAYVEADNTQFYVPHYIMYPTSGDHVKPYGSTPVVGNVHDHYQGLNLAAALRSKNLSYETNIGYTAADWQSNTSPKSVAYIQRLYSWCAGAVSGANRMRVIPLVT